MANEPVNLRAARWGRHTEPSHYTPAEALEAVLRDIQAGDIKPVHLVVCIAHDAGDHEQTHYYQSGQFGYHAQIGLVEAVASMMKNNRSRS